MLCSTRPFPWCQSSNPGEFLTTHAMPLKAELGGVVYHHYWEPVFSGSSTSLCVFCDIYFMDCSQGIQVISKDVESWSLGRYYRRAWKISPSKAIISKTLGSSWGSIRSYTNSIQSYIVKTYSESMHIHTYVTNPKKKYMGLMSTKCKNHVTSERHPRIGYDRGGEYRGVQGCFSTFFAYLKYCIINKTHTHTCILY